MRVVPDSTDSLRLEDTMAIEALVPEDQTLASTGELRMTLAKDILAGGVLVPCGTPVYGLAAMTGELSHWM